MKDEIIEQYRNIPEFRNIKQKILVKILGLLLAFIPVILGLIFWMLMDWFYALAALLLSFLISGIVSSKLRHNFVPIYQREFSYTSYELAAWVIAYYFDSEVEDSDEKSF